MYHERTVDVNLFYTAGNELVPVDPLPKRELIRLVDGRLDARVRRSNASMAITSEPRSYSTVSGS